MPVGLATAFVPGLAMLTVAVKVTLWPEHDGVGGGGHRRRGAGLVDHLADRTATALAVKLVSPLV